MATRILIQSCHLTEKMVELILVMIVRKMVITVAVLVGLACQAARIDNVVVMAAEGFAETATILKFVL